MKQTVTVRDNVSNKLRDGVSSELRGYVEVDVRNTKTGEIEHQENHNLIVYGGREWLLRRALGDTLGNNEIGKKTCIKWVGFGCGGGEAGNPLQSGATVGSDTDLRQPIRIRFDDDSNSQGMNGMYASRVLPNGSIIPGYFKKITDVTLKEDHANPYVQDGSTKYPTIIAEMRIELSSDDCNGENYTEKGNLIAYQDINELALFISDDSADPGKNGTYDEIFLNLAKAEEKIYNPGATISQGIQLDPTESKRTVTEAVPAGTYRLQYQKNNEWITIGKYAQVPVLGANMLVVREKNDRTLEFSFDGGSSWSVPEGWNYRYEGADSLRNNEIRFVALGTYHFAFKNEIPNVEDKPVYTELQYRNFYNEPWKVLDKHTFTDTTEVYKPFDPNGVICGTEGFEDISETTYFRVKETTIENQEIAIKAMEIDETSYDVKCYVSEEDIKKVSLGQFIYTPVSSDFGENTIPQSNPANIIDIYDPEVVNPETTEVHEPYFVIERSGLYNKVYDTAKVANVYSPSTEKPYLMFSRVALSSIRKTIDREIIIVYKIYC